MLKWLFKANKETAPSSSAPQVPPTAAAGAGKASGLIRVALQHHHAGRLVEAEAAYQKVLGVDPQNIDALHFLGVIAYQRGRYDQAGRLISEALSWNSANAPAHNNLGNVLMKQARFTEAVASYEQAIALQPDYLDAHINLCGAWVTQNELDQAVDCYQRALSSAPDSPKLYSGLASVLVRQRKLDEAAACYRRVLALEPDSPEAHFNLANALTEIGRFSEAIASYREALALKSDFPEALSNLGNALGAVDRLDEAAACCREALALRPDFPAALCNLGNALKNQDLLEEAIASYRKALALDPDLANVHYNLGSALVNAGRMDDAIDCFRKALSLNPEYAEARWMLAMSQLPAIYEADACPERYRDAFSRELGELERWFESARVSTGFKAVGVLQPFYLAYQEENNRALLERYGGLCTRLMADWFHRQNFAAPRRERVDDVVRVGVVSHQFRDHSVWNAIVKGWFQKLDRRRFAVDAFYLGSYQDQETLFAQSRASNFAQGAGGLRQWVETILDRRPDVLIYPEIGMYPMTVRLASLRLAPVQVASWGHPETTGLPTIDYYLSAEKLEPANAQDSYTERLVTLPNLGCFYQPARLLPAKSDPADLGIDPTAPILLCPGVPFKYAPQHDRILTEIARRLGRCQFIFFASRPGDMSNKLRRRLEIVFARSKLDFDDFVTFIPWQDRPAFCGLLKRANVFLDTIGFSGFNTAMQAVECGLPIVTKEGRFLRGRLASGILKWMGLQELVAESAEEYVDLAVRLCRDAEFSDGVRRRIEASRQALFEDEAPIRALETFLAEVARR